MKLFIGGIMQGSIQGRGIQDQAYRNEIADLVLAHYPDAQIYDPIKAYPDSVVYDRERASRTMLTVLERVLEADLLIAYVPAASMGTALEMWQAYRANIPVLAISPLNANWVLWTVAERIFPTLADFGAFVAAGGLAGYVDE